MSSWFRSWSVEEVEEPEEVDSSNTAGGEGETAGGEGETTGGEGVTQQAKESL